MRLAGIDICFTCREAPGEYEVMHSSGAFRGSEEKAQQVQTNIIAENKSNRCLAALHATAQGAFAVGLS